MAQYKVTFSSDRETAHALEAIGHPVKLIPSTSPNPKITTPADIPLAEALLHQTR